jgi:hypothetical protein
MGLNCCIERKISVSLGDNPLSTLEGHLIWTFAIRFLTWSLLLGKCPLVFRKSPQRYQESSYLLKKRSLKNPNLKVILKIKTKSCLINHNHFQNSPLRFLQQELDHWWVKCQVGCKGTKCGTQVVQLWEAQARTVTSRGNRNSCPESLEITAALVFRLRRPAQ